jgi:predicted N-acetyltransferase YhbS
MPTTHEIITLASDDQLREAIAIHAVIHGDPEPVWTDLLLRHPRWAAPSAHRAILDGGRIVALTSVASWQHRFGNTMLPASEIGLVGTLPGHRGRGHSRALMESWLATMRSERIPLSFLIGIPNFYERWGYHYAAPDHANHFLSIDREPLSRCAASGIAMRQVDAVRDVPAIRALIATELRHTPCSPVLDEQLLRHLIDRSDTHGVDWLVREEVRGTISAVARLKRWQGGTGPQAAGAVTLVAARDEDARKAVTAALLNHLGRDHATELPIAIAPYGPFARWLFERGAKRTSDRSVYPGGYAAMYRINDLPAVLETWRDDWDARELTSQAPDTAITLRTGADAAQVATIHVSPAGIAIWPGSGGAEVGAPPAVTVPWITGWRSAADWLDGRPFPPLPGPAVDTGAQERLSPSVRELLRALFPCRHPYIGDTIQGA